ARRKANGPSTPDFKGVSRCGVADQDFTQHGRLAEGARLFRYCHVRRDLPGRRRLREAVPRQRHSEADDKRRPRRICSGACARVSRHAIIAEGTLTWVPDAFAVGYWRRFLAAEMADYVFGRHAPAAGQEMHDIADDCRSLLERSGVEAPALFLLYHAID